MPVEGVDVYRGVVSGWRAARRTKMDSSATLTTSWTLLKRRPPTILRLSKRLSGSGAAPAVLCALLAHLLPLRFAHVLGDRLLRRRFPMTFSRGVDGAATAASGRGGDSPFFDVIARRLW